MDENEDGGYLTDYVSQTTADDIAADTGGYVDTPAAAADSGPGWGDMAKSWAGNLMGVATMGAGGYVQNKIGAGSGNGSNAQKNPDGTVTLAGKPLLGVSGSSTVPVVLLVGLVALVGVVLMMRKK